LSVQVPTSPPWFEGLPKDPRGFFVLAEASWVDGKPMFSKFDMDQTIALAMQVASRVVRLLWAKLSSL
jgi:hypothetical protein